MEHASEDPTANTRISECGRALAVSVVPAFATPEGVHIPTLIAACARMGGVALFRSAAHEAGAASPGAIVLSAAAEEHTGLLLRTCAGILQALGTTLASAPTEPLGSERDQPAQTFLETQAVLDPVFASKQAEFGLSDRQMGQAVAVATGMLVHHFGQYVEADRGFGIAAFAFAEGCRTMPAPRPVVA